MRSSSYFIEYSGLDSPLGERRVVVLLPHGDYSISLEEGAALLDSLLLTMPQALDRNFVAPEAEPRIPWHEPPLIRRNRMDYSDNLEDIA